MQSMTLEHEVHLATGSRGVLTDDAEEMGVYVHILPNLTRSIQLFGDFLAIQQCVDLIRRIKPNIIHAHSSKAGVIARIAGRFCKIPTVFTAHGWGFSPGTPALRRIVAFLTEILLAPISEKIICVSESDRQLALKWRIGSARTLITVHNGIRDLPDYVANPAFYPVRLIMVARFNEQKDQATLLKAIALLANPSIHLDLVGSGSSLSACKALATSLDLDHQVSFLGDRQDVPVLLARAQVFILSTHYEGLPISILEAMRAGLPGIATGVNGIPEQILHMQTGLLVPPEDVEALADAIDTLVRSPELRQKMGQAARERFDQEFSFEKMMTKTKAAYNLKPTLEVQLGKY